MDHSSAILLEHKGSPAALTPIDITPPSPVVNQIQRLIPDNNNEYTFYMTSTAKQQEGEELPTVRDFLVDVSPFSHIASHDEKKPLIQLQS
jgi:hypothetical protein